MLQSKKILAFLLVLFLTLPLFGCRSKTPAETQKSYDGIELTYYKVFDDEDVIEPIINEYITTKPGLKINYRKFSDFDEYQKVILNEMAQGEGPDIFSMQNTWFLANYKKLTPMPTDKGTVADFDETFVDIATKDLVRPDDNGDERVYGLPMTVDTLVLYYNKDHFEDRLPSQGKPSSTGEGIKNDVIALNKQNSADPSGFSVSGIALGRADNISRAVDTLYLMMLQYGAKFYNDTFSKSTFAGLRSDLKSVNPALDALDLFVSFADPDNNFYSWNELSAEDDSDAQEVAAFAQGKVSMIVGYSYTYDDILAQIQALKSQGVSTINKSAIRVAPIPQVYDPQVAKDKRVSYGSYCAETVSRNCKNSDIAWDFLIFLVSKENLKYYFEQTNKPTSRRDLIEEQKKDPIFGVFASQVGFAESFPILDYYRYKEIFTNIINQANTSGVDRSDLVSAQDLINEMLPKDGLIPATYKSSTPDTKATDEESDLEASE